MDSSQNHDTVSGIAAESQPGAAKINQWNEGLPNDENTEYIDIHPTQESQQTNQQQITQSPSLILAPPPSYEILFPKNSDIEMSYLLNMPPLPHQQSIETMQAYNPGIDQPVMVYYDADFIRESVQNSNEGLCGRCWCCYSLSFCAVYSVIILIVCFFIVGGPLTLFWSIPSTVFLILGAKKRNKSFITIGLGMHICFGILSFFILMPAWGFGLCLIVVLYA